MLLVFLLMGCPEIKQCVKIYRLFTINKNIKGISMTKTLVAYFSASGVTKIVAENLAKAAKKLSENPGALHLRTLETINEVSSDQSNTIFFALPIEVLDAIKGFADKNRCYHGWAFFVDFGVA